MSEPGHRRPPGHPDPRGGSDPTDAARIARTAALLRPYWRKWAAEQKGAADDNHDQADERVAFSVEEAAKLIGISRTFCYELIRSGRLRSVKLGNRRLIPRQALLDLVADLDAEEPTRED